MVLGILVPPPDLGGALDGINDGLGGIGSPAPPDIDFGGTPVDGGGGGAPGPDVGGDSGGGGGGGEPADPPTGGVLGAGLSEAEAETVAYLYEAGLNRNGEIDRPGLNYWIDQREAGLTERDLATAFLQSAEFAAAFGDPDKLSDQALVEVLYRNVLDREGEADGIAFWTGQVAQEEFDRADLLLAFAGSGENVAGSPFVETLEEIAPGDWDFVA